MATAFLQFGTLDRGTLERDPRTLQRCIRRPGGTLAQVFLWLFVLRRNRRLILPVIGGGSPSILGPTGDWMKLTAHSKLRPSKGSDRRKSAGPVEHRAKTDPYRGAPVRPGPGFRPASVADWPAVRTSSPIAGSGCGTNDRPRRRRRPSSLQDQLPQQCAMRIGRQPSLAARAPHSPPPAGMETRSTHVLSPVSL